MHALILIEVLAAKSVRGGRLHEMTKSYHVGLSTHETRGLIWAGFCVCVALISLLYKATLMVASIDYKSC